ncbi:MAG: tryptophan synthase subunit beta [Rhodobacteraceae bacterium]|nr:tryptophan synthase subunit beta [Paracoccaceae bacterium]
MPELAVAIRVGIHLRRQYLVDDDPTKNRIRLTRQLNAISRHVPLVGSVLRGLLKRNLWMFRLPIALVLIAGSVLAILPVFGLWMLPVGLALLAIDMPILRPMIVGAVIVGRRWLALRWRAWRPGK